MGLKINIKNAASFVGIFLATTTMTVASIVVILFLSTNGRATSLSWTASPDPIISWSQVMQPTGGENKSGCKEEQKIPRMNQGPLSRACVFSGSSVRFIAEYMSYVSFGDEEKFYTVYGVGAFNGLTGPILLPRTDTMYLRGGISYDRSYLAIYKNFASRFVKRIGESSYNWNSANPNFELRDGAGAYIPVRNAGHSENGNWIVVEALERGIILVNVETGQSTLISKYRGYYGVGANPSMEFRVSNDGKHVAIGGLNVEFRVIDADNCGDDATTNTVLTTATMAHPCPERALGSKVRDSTPVGVDKRWITEPRFNSDSTELSVLVGQPDAGLMHVATLTAPGLAPSQRLDYLALGDSYSSGEGDIEKRAGELKYYIRGTDIKGDYSNGIPEERCHISSRSYPYKLMQDMSATRESAKSIACSGAAIDDVVGNSKYDGQFSRLAKGPRLLGLTNTLQLQEDALTDFIPGRIHQQRFVEMYKPRAITLTLGGNDVRFAEKLRACIINHPLSVCSLASEKGRAQLGKEIQPLFQSLKVYIKK